MPSEAEAPNPTVPSTEANLTPEIEKRSNPVPSSTTRAEPREIHEAAIRSVLDSRRAILETPGSSLQKWRESLDKMARISKRGEKSVEFRRKVLIALETGSDRALSDAVASLPIERRDEAVSVGGAQGTMRTYLINGVEHASGFFPTERADVDDGEPDASPAVPRRGPSAFELAPVPEASCTTVWEGITYSGDCATQAELDEALALIAALDYEVNADWEEAEETCLTLAENPQSCYFDQEENNSAILIHDLKNMESDYWPSSSEDYALDALESGEHPTALPDPTCAVADATSTSARDGCFLEGAAAGAAVFAWVANKISANDTMKYGASRAGKVAVVGGLILGAFSTGYAIGTWLDCMAA